jgi:hypothetical protein
MKKKRKPALRENSDTGVSGDNDMRDRKKDERKESLDFLFGRGLVERESGR